MLFPFLKAMEFFAIVKRIGGLLGVDTEKYAADPALAAKPAEPVGFDNEQRAIARAERQAAGGRENDAAVLHAADVHAKMKALPIDHAAYETIADAAALNRWIARIYDEGAVAVDTETTGLDNQQADLVGISLSVGPGTGAYIPLAHTRAPPTLLDTGGIAEGQMPIREAIDLLKPVLRRPLDPQNLPQREVRPRRARALRPAGHAATTTRCC